MFTWLVSLGVWAGMLYCRALRVKHSPLKDVPSSVAPEKVSVVSMRINKLWFPCYNWTLKLTSETPMKAIHITHTGHGHCNMQQASFWHIPNLELSVSRTAFVFCFVFPSFDDVSHFVLVWFGFFPLSNLCNRTVTSGCKMQSPFSCGSMMHKINFNDK